VGLDLVLDEGAEEVVEERARKVAGFDGGAEGDEDGMLRSLGRVVTLVEHVAPGFEQTECRGGVGYFIAEVVGDAAKGVDALEVRADAFRQKEGGDVKVFIVRGGEGGTTRRLLRGWDGLRA
jgi:hypothetical protein